MKKITHMTHLREGAQLKHPETLKIELELELSSCPEFDSHCATFCYQDFACTVTEGNTDKELGEIIAGIGGLLFVKDEKSHYRYVLDPRKLWAEFQKALTEQLVKPTP